MQMYLRRSFHQNKDWNVNASISKKSMIVLRRSFHQNKDWNVKIFRLNLRHLRFPQKIIPSEQGLKPGGILCGCIGYVCPQKIIPSEQGLKRGIYRGDMLICLASEDHSIRTRIETCFLPVVSAFRNRPQKIIPSEQGLKLLASRLGLPDPTQASEDHSIRTRIETWSR